jgi:hypothetical protein
VRAIEVTGDPDAVGGGYLARSFDSEGNADVMHVTIDEESVLHFAGGADIAPPRNRPMRRLREFDPRSRSPKIVDP